MDNDNSIDARLKAGMRKIRNIEFNHEDCEALLNPGTKLKGPAINTLGALFQQQAEQDPDVVPDWCIFSLWLGIVTGLRNPQVSAAGCPGVRVQVAFI